MPDIYLRQGNATPGDITLKDPTAYRVDYQLVVDAVAFALGGQNISLAAARRVAAERGAYSFSGNDSLLAVVRRILASATFLSLAGQDVSLRTLRRLKVSPGIYQLVGSDAALQLVRGILASTGLFILSGSDVGFLHPVKLSVESGSFIFAGRDVKLKKLSILVCPGGVFVLTGMSSSYRFKVLGFDVKEALTVASEIFDLEAEPELEVVLIVEPLVLDFEAEPVDNDLVAEPQTFEFEV